MSLVEKLGPVFDLYRTQSKNMNVEPQKVERNISIVRDFLYRHENEVIEASTRKGR